MDGKPIKPVSLSIFLLLSFIYIPSSFSLKYQTFVPDDTQFRTQTFTESARPDSEPVSISESENTLSLDLHHIDHILSTTNDPNSTPQSLLILRLQRDSKRVKALSSARKNRGINSPVISGVAYGSGEYFTRLGIGTPSKYVYMILDTGSDVIWLQCARCKSCYNQADPIFDPKKSKTYSRVACGSELCRQLDFSRCGSPGNKTCHYRVSYGDNSSTTGEFSTETLTFLGGMVKEIAFGCGHNNTGLFKGAAGLLGLSRGKLSFPNQSFLRFGGKFSYCLVDWGSNNKSSILFGEPALSRKAIFTPLLTNPDNYQNTFYYVGLNGISIGGSRVPLPKNVFEIQSNGDGGVIVDSGTTITRLSEPAYTATRDAFRKAFKFPLSKGISLLDTCFDLSGMTNVSVPTVILHFTNVNMKLPAKNYLVLVDDNGTFCFAFAKMEGISIIGNFQQQGYRVSYDLMGKQVGFTPNSC